MHTFLETLSENAQFVLLCLGITAGVLLLAWVSEKLVMRRRHRLNAAHTITTIAILAAISGVLMVIEIPLFFAPSFYKLDFSELPVLICAFYLGPVSGVVCEFLDVYKRQVQAVGEDEACLKGADIRGACRAFMLGIVALPDAVAGREDAVGKVSVVRQPVSYTHLYFLTASTIVSRGQPGVRSTFSPIHSSS